MHKLLSSLILMTTGLLTLTGQTEDLLINPSFEDLPHNSRPPVGWTDCGFIGETPVDIQPGHFEVKQAASRGDTYLGMVVRDNETYESVGARLATPFVKGQAYAMEMDLSQSQEYISQSRLDTEKQVNYNTPCRIRVWGGHSYCEKESLLFATVPVDHADWKRYRAVFRAPSNYGYLVIEVYYKKFTLIPYNGNILVDNLSLEPHYAEIDANQSLVAILPIGMVEASAKPDTISFSGVSNEVLEKALVIFVQNKLRWSQNLPEKIALWWDLYQIPNDWKNKYSIENWMRNLTFRRVRNMTKEFIQMGYRDFSELTQKTEDLLFNTPDDAVTNTHRKELLTLQRKLREAVEKEDLSFLSTDYLANNREIIIQQLDGDMVSK